jgi:hypothetical protein
MALLATPAAQGYFPSLGVRCAWIGFDAVLVTGLLSLARRWRHRLAVTLAMLISADAVTTAVEAARFNAPRVHGFWAGAWVVAGVLAPSTAAAFLWQAVRAKRRLSRELARA